MRYALEIHPKAENETLDAYNWYEDQYNGLGEMFLSDLESVYKKIELNPDFFSKAGKGFRQAVLKQFPYVVVYEIKRTRVVVYAVFHTSRNPKQKFRRK
jgi:hypothetical protein